MGQKGSPDEVWCCGIEPGIESPGMGHRRVGLLPRTTKWRDIVSELSTLGTGPDQTDALVAATLDGVRDRFKNIDGDHGVNASFKFLVLLAVAARSQDLRERLSDDGITLIGQATPLALARSVSAWVDSHQGSLEYAELSKAAASDAIAAWFEKHRSDGPGLFEAKFSADEAWRSAATGSGFCELSRLYFARFTERYLKYFLDREASSEIRSVEERDRVETRLRASIEGVSKHAFETAQITQSFAAGWFNKHALYGVPSDRKIRSFLSVAFGKLREELRREGLR